MKILYYTAGQSGSGNIVRGVSLCTALQRRGGAADFTILSSNPASTAPADALQISHREIPFENERVISRGGFRSSALYGAITSMQPDVLVVGLHWFMLHHFIRELPCKKVFLCRQVADRFFRLETGEDTLVFRPEDYDLALAIEPFHPPVPLKQINPMVIRNRDEILPAGEAAQRLGGRPDARRCLFSYTGAPDEVERVRKLYSYLPDEGFEMVHAAKYEGGLFPVVDYFDAFDLLICGAGYNSFWEAVYFQKEAVFIPQPRHFEDQKWRVEECQEHVFDRNGADQLVDLILGL